MANTQYREYGKNYAVVDTAPGTDGFATPPLKVGETSNREVTFYILGDFSATIDLQMKEENDDSWTDYESFTTNEARIIRDTGTASYRAIIKNGNYTSGTVKFGFFYKQ